MEIEELQPILEAAVMASDAPISVERLTVLFALSGEDAPSGDEIRAALEALQASYQGRGVELVEVAGGYRFQTREQYADWVNRLWEERKPRYSRALLETIAIIAYRQPITRGEIEAIRGVAVSTGIIKTLHDREWIKIVGHRDVPGRPAIYATTRQFLEYFGLTSLAALPTLAELKDFDEVNPDLFAELESATIVDLVESPEEPAVDPQSTPNEAEATLSHPIAQS
jgi:segregation and condensation protein B